MKFEDSQAPLTDELLSSAETELGIRFPPGLRAHYLRTNGGVPDAYIRTLCTSPVLDAADVVTQARERGSPVSA
jgi:cell wall assembly regulator SMI1